MNNEIEKFTYNVTQCYLEMARSAFTSLHSAGSKEELKKEHPQEMANALFAIASTSVIYSYMAVESFVNCQLYRIWEERDSNTDKGRAFRSEFPDVNGFKGLQKHKSVGELKERLKLICRLLGYKQLHDEEPQLWNEFNQLFTAVRHSLVHPLPDPVEFNETMRTIMEQKKAGTYVEIAEKIIKYLYGQAKHEVPEWLQGNKLLRSRGYTLLVEKE
jgi:hypothetical protein